MHCTTYRLAVAIALALALPSAHAADVSVQPSAGSGFVVKDATGTNERLRVQETGVVSLPGIASAPAQPQSLCAGTGGQLGPCSSTSGSSYASGTGLALAGTTFSVAPTYQLPQGCTANQIAQWSGTAWACGNAGGTLPAGTVNQTLRYDASNTLVASDLFQVFSNGDLLAARPANPAVRLMWHPLDGAFRAGFADAAQWDETNIGGVSMALGRNTTAKGYASIAMGEDTFASGKDSIAAGFEANALADSAVALGHAASATATASIAMGQNSSASGAFSTAMGYFTTAAGLTSTAMGHQTNADGKYATAMGDQTDASGEGSTAMGSFVSTNGHKGSFIYGDASRTIANGNNADNQFMVLANGGTIFYSNSAATAGVSLAHAAGSWTTLSDRAAKTAIRSVNGREVLEKVVAMPLNTWQYKAQEEKYRHMGPMAQDFYAAFHLGESDKGIDTVDADGVALAAIQGLHAELTEKNREMTMQLKDKDAEIAALRAESAEQAKTHDAQIARLRNEKDLEVATLRAELSTQKARVATLESLAGEIVEMKAQLAALRRSPPAAVSVALKP